jgi:hypothetical protein
MPALDEVRRRADRIFAKPPELTGIHPRRAAAAQAARDRSTYIIDGPST